MEQKLSQYKSGNILGTQPSPAHSGPELCIFMPESSRAEELASQVVLNRLEITQTFSSHSGFGGRTDMGLRLDLR